MKMRRVNKIPQNYKKALVTDGVGFGGSHNLKEL